MFRPYSVHHYSDHYTIEVVITTQSYRLNRWLSVAFQGAALFHRRVLFHIRRTQIIRPVPMEGRPPVPVVSSWANVHQGSLAYRLFHAKEKIPSPL